MPKIPGNIVKGWITSVIGTATMIITLVLIFTKVIDFVWEGIGGLIIGAILLMAPASIERLLSQALRRKSDRENCDYDDRDPHIGD